VDEHERLLGEVARLAVLVVAQQLALLGIGREQWRASEPLLLRLLRQAIAEQHAETQEQAGGDELPGRSAPRVGVGKPCPSREQQRRLPALVSSLHVHVSLGGEKRPFQKPFCLMVEARST
jgi:hypothetical protein